MKKFAILGIALALVGCSEPPAGSTVAKLDSSPALHTVCLDGVQYWFREGNNAVLAPRMRSAKVGTAAHVITCEQAPQTNDAAVIGVISQM